MKGLLKNNFYASFANLKAFSIIMAFLGIAAIAMGNNIQMFLIGYMLLGMIGFSFLSIDTIAKETTTKWAKHILAAPIRRADIVKSYYISQIIWLFAGMLFASLGVILSMAFHGYPFDKVTDIPLVFSMGIAISCLMSAVIFPLFSFGGAERKEVFLIISLLCAIGIMAGLVALANRIIGPGPTNWQIILTAIILTCLALTAFTASYFLTAKIFQKKEY